MQTAIAVAGNRVADKARKIEQAAVACLATVIDMGEQFMIIQSSLKSGCW